MARASAKFCSECGTRLAADEALPEPAASREPREAERRQLTVMFCDLVGSTVLSTELDPEDLREVIRAYQEVCASVVRDLGGHVAQYLGDGLLIYFGFPVAHEDSAQRAVGSGLEIIRSMRSLNVELQRTWKLRLAVRIGLHTGVVVIGEMGGAGRYEHLALGDTPNIAARIQGLAEPDTVLMSSATHRLVEGAFRVQDFGRHLVKGVDEPISVFQVLEGRQEDRRSRLSAAAEVPLVGRAEEKELLIRCWEDVEAGQGRVVLLHGEAGIGKSRLIRFLRETAPPPAADQLVFRCSAYQQQTAFHPLLDHLERSLQLTESDTVEEKLAKLERLAVADGAPDSRPIFRSLLSLPAADAPTPAAGVSPLKQREMIHEALANWLTEQTSGGPALVIWEDLHWADPSTLELLSRFMERVPGHRILLLLAYRTSSEIDWPAGSASTALELGRLDREEAEELILAVAEGKPLPREVVRQLIAKADGIPLYLEELTRMVLESEWLREVEGRYQLSGPLPAFAIPDTLQDSLTARLDRLEAVRAVVQMAAALGREFPYRMLRAISSVDEATLEEGLTRLVDARLLRQHGNPPRLRYSFKNALIQETAYNSLLKSRRNELHRKIALLLEKEEVIADARPGEAGSRQLALLAYHWSRAVDPRHPDAGLVDRATGFLRLAGERDLQLNAYQEAYVHYQAALDLVTVLPEDAARNEKELVLQVLLSNILKATRGWASPEVKRAYDRARALCSKLNGRPELAQVLFGLWGYHLWYGEYEKSRELAEECFELGRRFDDSDLLMEAHCALGSTLFWLGELPDALRHAQRVLQLFETERHQAHLAQYGQDPRIIAMQFLVGMLVQVGRADDAAALHEEMLDLTRELSHPFSQAIALLTSMEFHRRQSDPAATRRAAEELIELSLEMGFPNYEMAGRFFQQWAMAAAGQAEVAAGPIQEMFATYPRYAGEVALVHGSAIVAEVCWWAGRPQEALDTLEDGLARARRNRELAFEAELYCLRGEILAELAEQSRRPTQAALHRAHAEASLRQALDLAGRRWQIVFAERSARALSSLLIRSDRRDEAQIIHAESRRLREEIPDAARRLLDDVRTAQWPQRPGDDGVLRQT